MYWISASQRFGERTASLSDPALLAAVTGARERLPPYSSRKPRFEAI